MLGGARLTTITLSAPSAPLGLLSAYAPRLGPFSRLADGVANTVTFGRGCPFSSLIWPQILGFRGVALRVNPARRCPALSEIVRPSRLGYDAPYSEIVYAGPCV